MRTTSPALDPRYQSLIQLLRTADTIVNASRAFFAPWDLSPSQFNVLNLLYWAENGLSQTQLSLELIVHRSNITGLVDRLEARGLTIRHDVESDRRAYRVALTRRGRDLMKEVLPLYYRAACALWEGIPPGRLACLTADLAQAARNCQQIVTSRNSNQILKGASHEDRDPNGTGGRSTRAARRRKALPVI